MAGWSGKTMLKSKLGPAVYWSKKLGKQFDSAKTIVCSPSPLRTTEDIIYK